ncbi:MAG TPA: DUF1549 and DUF1553 domain-containing protein [Planctomycetota bacterium]|nr:DUF1549 and DUF1553 domain-containing protein [Planctomycetota bacterium]
MHWSIASTSQIATLLVLIGSAAQALDFDKPDEKVAYKALQNYVADSLQAAIRDGAPKKMRLLVGGTQREFELIGCDNTDIQLRAEGRIQVWKWFRFNRNETAALGLMCVDDRPERAKVLAEYCQFSGQKELAQNATKLAAKLESEQAKGEIAVRTKAASMEFEAEWRPEAVKIAFRPSTFDVLTPATEVAAAIDNIIDIGLSELEIPAEPACDDLAFLRRVSLDLNGQIPSPDEVLAFYKDATPNKRAKKIQELLARPEFAEHWATQFQVMLVGRQSQDRFYYGNQNLSLRTWLRDALRENRSYDRIVRSLLTGIGSEANAQYLAHHLRTTTLPVTADKVARDFLGKRIACAQCHDHPFDKWTQNDFWGFAAFLSATQGGYGSLGDTDQRLTGMKYDPPAPEYVLPPRIFDGAPLVEPPPAPPEEKEGGGGMPMKKRQRANEQEQQPQKPPEQMIGYKYRQALAEYVTSPQNRDFDRAAVNRMWKHFFGHGLVEPVDDLRPKNGASHPQVLDLLADEFAASGRDLKRLAHILVLTQAYQRASSGKPVKAERFRQVRFAGRAEVRPLTPEMLFVAIMKSTLGEDKTREALMAIYEPEKFYSDPRRQRQVDPNAQEFYSILQRFFTRSDATEIEDPLQFEGSFTQALMMMNSDLMNKAIREATSKNSRRGIDMTYLFALTLGRPPSAAEQEAFKEFKGSLEQILWILLNTAEFVTVR